MNLGNGILDMSPYCAKAQSGTSQSGTSQSSTYDLIGVVDHAGSTASGHYMARCKAATTGRWYLANDSVVVEGSRPSDLQMPGTLPYMLIYHLKD